MWNIKWVCSNPVLNICETSQYQTIINNIIYINSQISEIKFAWKTEHH